MGNISPDPASPQHQLWEVVRHQMQQTLRKRAKSAKQPVPWRELLLSMVKAGVFSRLSDEDANFWRSEIITNKAQGLRKFQQFCWDEVM